MSETVKSYKPEFLADNSGEWAENALRFATMEEAALWAKGLERRWTMVREWRVVPSADPVNYRVVGDGDAVPVE